MVDADGNILPTAVKTEDGFEFTHIPTSGEYFYKLENMLREQHRVYGN